MQPFPRDPSFDSTLALRREGYLFGLNRFRSLGTDVFEMRLLLQRAICLYGEEAATLFYDTERFVRVGAMPLRAQRSLLGVGGVQSLDADAHRQRKAMFLRLLTGEARVRLWREAASQWAACLRRWSDTGHAVVLDDTRVLLTKAVCAWAGVPLDERDAGRRARHFGAMIDGAGGVGPRYWRARWGRLVTEAWIAGLIRDVRKGRLAVAEHLPLPVVAWHREPDGKLLDPRTAAVELINTLRPTVAIARYVAFCALALHEHPEWAPRLGEDEAMQAFVDEVRRYYPFFPMVAARTWKAFAWRGHRFDRGVRVLLDLYATNHDPRIWSRPDEFDPERFLGREPSAFAFVPQGGGRHEVHHRCPGEWMTTDMMKLALQMLTTRMAYTVPAQDLRVSLARMPALPASRVVLARVEPLR